MPSLIEKLNIGDADISTPRFDKVAARASWAGYKEQELKKATSNGVDMLLLFQWKLEEELEAKDGRKFPPGKIIVDKRWVNSSDPADVEKLAGACKRVICALRGLPVNHSGPLAFEDADVGREALLKFSYTPGKDNPSDPELGFQNVAAWALKPA